MGSVRISNGFEVISPQVFAYGVNIFSQFNLTVYTSYQDFRVFPTRFQEFSTKNTVFCARFTASSFPPLDYNEIELRYTNVKNS